jgi:hypothetical protein
MPTPNRLLKQQNRELVDWPGMLKLRLPVKLDTNDEDNCSLDARPCVNCLLLSEALLDFLSRKKPLGKHRQRETSFVCACHKTRVFIGRSQARINAHSIEQMILKYMPCVTGAWTPHVA